MCEYIEEGGIDVADGEPWGREFLDYVASARQAVERAATLATWRNRGPHASEDYDEDGAQDPYEWATAVLDEFDEMAAVQRQIVRGDMLEGLDIAEAKYRLGMKTRAITGQFHISNDTMYRRLSLFVEYLDSIGPLVAFGNEETRNEVGFAAPPMTRAEMLEDAGIMPAPDDMEVVMYGAQE